ncbi:uncharacterized protein MELLADRAFT_106101 [Melampsora larici-populina 98AG31]|uniref:Secreted protein n=1 Tax=Melampsora larici-populina (strain 98AG31 / pathotype 3-4-7) TaxID=747676 RepID=F4RKE0_MELLP|nr:uncharacterized protein MELLADRAFT_106101 [Melampsora larici-populina 98AG31]EGG07198.1 hypothetical protein MELLADRAFT_106101 [Melampsora larici-populina 98AG31]
MLTIVVIMSFIHSVVSVKLLPGGPVHPGMSQLETASPAIENVKEFGRGIGPIEKIMLQDENLETWRDIRTIEEVVKQNRDSTMFGKRLNYYIGPILKDCPSWMTENSQIESSITEVNVNIKSPLERLVHQLILILMKGHSKTKEQLKLDLLEAELSNKLNQLSKNKDPRIIRKIVAPFVDYAISKIGWHILLENFQKSMTLEYGSNHSLEKHLISYQFKMNDQLQYGAYYRDYMHMFEIFEILVDDGLKHQNLICNLAKIQSQKMKETKILNDHTGSAIDIHRHLINRTPWNGHPWSPVPFFEDPLKTYGHKSTEFSEKVHKLWFILGENDRKISNQLGMITEEVLAEDYKVSQKLEGVENLGSFQEAKQDNILTYNLAVKHMSRAIDLVSNLDEDDPEVLSILCEIFTTSIKFIVKKGDYKEQKGVINNSVMFYLFIRRTGNVLSHVLKSLFPNKPLEEKLTTAQSMRYHWSLAKFKSNHYGKDQAMRWRWLNFELGQVYQEHLLASDKLNDFYNQMGLALHSKKGVQERNPVTSKIIPSRKQSYVIETDRKSQLAEIVFDSAKDFSRGQDSMADQYNTFKRKAFNHLKELHSNGELHGAFLLNKSEKTNNTGKSTVGKNVESKRVAPKKTQFFGTPNLNEYTMLSDGLSNNQRDITSCKSLKDQQDSGYSQPYPSTTFSKTKKSSEKRKGFNEKGFFDKGWPKKSRTKTFNVLDDESPEIIEIPSSINPDNPGFYSTAGSSPAALDPNKNSHRSLPPEMDQLPPQRLHNLHIEKAYLFDLNELPESDSPPVHHGPNEKIMMTP